MNNLVTEEQQRFYAENGYLVVEEFLDSAELEAWREAVDEAVAERGSQRFSFVNPEADRIAATVGEEDRVSYYDQVFTQRVNLWQTNDKVKKLLFDPELAKLPGRVANVDGLRVWHDQALIKEPWGNPTAFHIDVPYWSFTSADAITIWLALDDATLENGCLYYVAGTHLAKKFDNVGIGPELGALFKVYPEWAELRPVPCPVPAGGALLHNGLLAHGAGANLTPGRRRAMTCGFMPDGSRFNGTQNVLPPEYFRTLHVGDVLDNDNQNPLLYRREGL